MDASRIVEALTHHRALRSNPATFNETPIGNNTSQCVSLSGEQMATFLQIQHQTLWPRKNVIICSHSFRRIPTHGHWIGRNSSAHNDTHRAHWRGGWIGRQGPDLFVLGRRSTLSAASFILEGPGLGKQSELSRWTGRFRPADHSTVPGVSRNLL